MKVPSSNGATKPIIDRVKRFRNKIRSKKNTYPRWIVPMLLWRLPVLALWRRVVVVRLTSVVSVAGLAMALLRGTVLIVVVVVWIRHCDESKLVSNLSLIDEILQVHNKKNERARRRQGGLMYEGLAFAISVSMAGPSDNDGRSHGSARNCVKFRGNHITNT
jgi:hypothetical protein